MPSFIASDLAQACSTLNSGKSVAWAVLATEAQSSKTTHAKARRIICYLYLRLHKLVPCSHIVENYGSRMARARRRKATALPTLASYPTRADEARPAVPWYPVGELRAYDSISSSLPSTNGGGGCSLGRQANPSAERRHALRELLSHLVP